MKISLTIALTMMLAATMALTFTGCDDEKSDCEKVCDKLGDCCDWDNDDANECTDECNYLKDEMTTDEFNDVVDMILGSSCRDLDSLCYGYGYNDSY